MPAGGDFSNIERGNVTNRLFQNQEHPRAALMRLADELYAGWLAATGEYDKVDAALAEIGDSDGRERCLALMRKSAAIVAGIQLLFRYLREWRAAVRASVRGAVDEFVEQNPQKVLELVLAERSNATRDEWASDIWAVAGAAMSSDDEIERDIAALQLELQTALAEAEQAALAFS
jgi:hypothetical protein